MMKLLFAKHVITNNERQIIKTQVGEDKMMYHIADIIIPSLQQNFSAKYKGLLEAMEESDDIDLNNVAKLLGKLQ